MGDDAIPLTRAAFSRFWVRYSEADEAKLIDYAQTDPQAAEELDILRDEIAYHWKLLVEECEREPAGATMTPELAEHISLLAAPIYAALLEPWVTRGELVPAATLDTFRKLAIQQAQALWLETLDTPESSA